MKMVVLKKWKSGNGKSIGSKDLSLEFKIKLMKCYVEAWAMNYRWMLRISWTDKVINIKVWRRMKKDKDVT